LVDELPPEELEPEVAAPDAPELELPELVPEEPGEVDAPPCEPLL